MIRSEQQRKASHKLALREVLAKEPIPIREEVVAELLGLFVTDFRDVLQAHRGYALENKICSLRTTFRLFTKSYWDLISALDRFDGLSREPLFNFRAGESQTNEIEEQIRKEIFAFSALAHSLTDHCRIVRARWDPSGTAEQLSRFFGDDGLHNFVCGLRNALHHESMVEADWQIRNIGPGATSHFIFSRRELLAIEKAWNGAARSYLAKQCTEEIDVRTVVQSYATRVQAFYDWLLQECEEAPPPEVQDYRRCWARHRQQSSRAAWSFLIGEFQKRHIDPYAYLQNRYLTEEEYALAMKFPMRSRQQVDFIIATLDKWNACDSDMRARVYRLFDVETSHRPQEPV